MRFCINDLEKILVENKITFKIYGNPNVTFDNFCTLFDAKNNCITWSKQKDNMVIEDLNCLDNVTIVCNEFDDSFPLKLAYIVTDMPKAAFFMCVEKLFVVKPEKKVSKNSVVLAKQIGENFSIGDFSTICADVIIGNDVTIGNNVSIICPTTIGDGSSIASGVVIGTDGFGYYKDANGVYQKVPHSGGVVIGNNVDIGANTCVDRGTIGNTIIEDNVKIDNLCHIGHNCKIGYNSLIIANSTLGGSCVLENNSYLAPGANIINQCRVGENSLIGMGAVVGRDVPEGKVMFGVPARIIRDND